MEKKVSPTNRQKTPDNIVEMYVLRWETVGILAFEGKKMNLIDYKFAIGLTFLHRKTESFMSTNFV